MIGVNTCVGKNLTNKGNKGVKITGIYSYLLLGRRCLQPIVLSNLNKDSILLRVENIDPREVSS